MYREVECNSMLFRGLIFYLAKIKMREPLAVRRGMSLFNVTFFFSLHKIRILYGRLALKRALICSNSAAIVCMQQ